MSSRYVQSDSALTACKGPSLYFLVHRIVCIEVIKITLDASPIAVFAVKSWVEMKGING
jgi:hypothetical protein